MCVIYDVSKNTDNILIKLFGIILLFLLIFIYFIASDIKGRILKEEAEEKKKNKYKYENKFCYFCGQKLEKDEKVCPNCGENIGDGS
jgi:ribosomal protein S27AE